MILGPLDGLRIVDLYAGSGALAIEALSRGAAWADLVDADRHACAAARRNLEELGLLERAKLWRIRLPGGLALLADAVRDADIVFADPPYGGADLDGIFSRLGSLKPTARLVLETHAKDGAPAAAHTFVRTDTRRYGETMLHIYECDEAHRQEEGS